MNRMWTAAAMALAGVAGAHADSTSVEFYDPTGTTVTSKVGWKGTAAAGEFFIETPNDGNGVTIKQGNITANKFTGDGSGLTGLPKATPWDSVTGKPASFPAATHTHAAGDVSGLQAALDGKASLAGASFTGAVGFQQNVSIDLGDTLKFGAGLKMTSYSPTGGVYEGLIDAPHGIKMPTKVTIQDADAQMIIIGTAGANPPELAVTGDATVSGAITAGRFNGDGSGLTNLPASSADWSSITNKPTAFPPATHTHATGDVSGLQTALDGKASLAGATFTGTVNFQQNGEWQLGDSIKFGAGLKMTSYSPTGGVYEGLIDAPHGIRMPTKLTLSGADAQVIIVGTAGANPPELGITGDATVSGTVTAGNFSGNGSGLTGVPVATHGHGISDVTNLQTTLNGKADLAGALFTGNVGLELGDTLKFGAGLRTHSYSPTGGVYEAIIDCPNGIRIPTMITMNDADARLIIIGTAGANPPELAITGDATVSGSVTAASFPTSSDERLKENIAPLTGGLEKVSKIRGVTFDFRSAENPERALPSTRQVGVLAQDVERVLPEVVQTDADGYKSVDYGKLTALLIEAVKEQQAEIESLRARLDRIQPGQ